MECCRIHRLAKFNLIHVYILISVLDRTRVGKSIATRPNPLPSTPNQKRKVLAPDYGRVRKWESRSSQAHTLILR